jgi:hypothetical protein
MPVAFTVAVVVSAAPMAMGAATDNMSPAMSNSGDICWRPRASLRLGGFRRRCIWRGETGRTFLRRQDR